MGCYIRQTLIVTGYGTHFDNAYFKALELFDAKIDSIQMCLVSNEVKSFNKYSNFTVFDSGSKSGWELSGEFLRRMSIMIDYLKSNDCVFEDKSSCNDWVLVEYGDTGRRVKNSNCRNRY